MVPPFRALLTVDAEGYSRNPDADLPGLHIGIRNAVERACERSGLRDAWQGARVVQSTGDGLFAVLPVDTMPALIHPFPDQLHYALAAEAAGLRAHGLCLRLRAALHVGMVDDEDPLTGGISAAAIVVSRLLDCTPLRAALRDSDPDTTFAAMIISAEVFEQFVAARYADLPASRFTPVRAQVKQFDRPAYLYVPVPSRCDHDHAPGPEEASSEARPAASGGVSASRVSVTGRGTQNVIGAQVSGGIRQRRS